MTDNDREIARTRREEAQRWLRLACEDLRVASICRDAKPPALTSAVFHVQQGAEKALKGFLVLARIRVRKTHDLDVLADLAAPAYPELKELFDAARPLTVWAVAFRYPSAGDVEEVVPDVSEQEEALKVVDRLAAALSTALSGDV